MLRPILKSSILSASIQRAVVRNTRSMTILSKESKEDFKRQNYTERMGKSGRPVSPHVTIYSFPITALTSVTNRVTGVALSFGAFGVSAMELVGGSGTALAFCQSVAQMDSVVIPAVAKFSVAFPFVYHFCGGVRHMSWDHKPELLTNKGVEQSSKILVGSSIVLTGASLLI